LAQSQGDIILAVIRIDFHCHLKVTVAQQSHFAIKSTVAQPKSLQNTNRKSYVFCPIVPSSMTLQHVSRSNCQQQCPICFLPEILALMEVYTLWVLFSY